MAAAHCSTTAFHLHLSSTAIKAQFSKKSLPIISSIYISTPKRPTNRKNYLRRKFLKTLNKPHPDSVIPQPAPPPPPPQENPEATLLPSSPSDAGKEVKEVRALEFDQSEASESVEVVGGNGNVGSFNKSSALKFGLWLAGAFVFQTICAVWVFSSADFGKRNEDDKVNRNNVSAMGFNGKDESRLKLYVNGKFGFGDKRNLYTSEAEIVKKIEAIKVMAREVREKERLEKKRDDLDGNESDFEDDEDNVDFGKSEIEKEVNERLDKLRKRLEKDHEKFSEAYLKGRRERKVGVDKNNLMDENDANDRLLFKKKYKFKGSLSEERDRAKGFSGLSDHSERGKRRSNSRNEDLTLGTNGDTGVNMLDGRQGSELELREVKEQGKKEYSEVSEPLRTVEKESKSIDVGDSKVRKAQDRNYGSLSVKMGDSRETSIASSDRHNGSLKGGGFGHRQSSGTKKRSHETDWWLGLPFVLVILMQHEGEGQHGLYSLKGTPNAEDGSSHLVAFADRGDAINFCYLLQSFFEDLGDVTVDVVPLSIKELEEVMESENKKVIVLKKGQVQLYAGQPLADVEMALHSLLEEQS